jgi:hypothetical protein
VLNPFLFLLRVEWKSSIDGPQLTENIYAIFRKADGMGCIPIKKSVRIELAD